MQSYNKPITLTTTIPVKTLEKTSPCFSPFFNCLEEQKRELHRCNSLFQVVPPGIELLIQVAEYL